MQKLDCSIVLILLNLFLLLLLHRYHLHERCTYYIVHALLKCNDVNFDPKQISELSIYGNDFLYLKIDKITFQTGV